MSCIWCSVHGANAESFIARCFYSLWASALDRCELREMELKPVEVEGQGGLFCKDCGLVHKTSQEALDCDAKLPTNIQGAW